MNIFKKKKQSPKEKVFTFSTITVAKIGDKYEYKVKATSKTEAFKKLVQYFFAVEESNYEDIESNHSG